MGNAGFANWMTASRSVAWLLLPQSGRIGILTKNFRFAAAGRVKVLDIHPIGEATKGSKPYIMSLGW